MVRENFIYTIIGRRGTGKTTLAKIFLYTKIDGLTIIIDPQEEFKFIKECYNARDGWYKIVEHYNTNRKEFNIVRIVEDDIEQTERLLQLIYDECRKITLIIDEIDMLFSPTNNKTVLNKIVNFSRNRKFNIIGTAKRPAMINRLLTSQTDNLYFFHTIEPRDIEYIRNYVNNNASIAVQTLEQFNTLNYDLNTGKFKIEKIPKYVTKYIPKNK